MTPALSDVLFLYNKISGFYGRRHMHISTFRLTFLFLTPFAYSSESLDSFNQPQVFSCAQSDHLLP